MSLYTEIYNEWAQGMVLDLPEPLIGHDATALKERKVHSVKGLGFNGMAVFEKKMAIYTTFTNDQILIHWHISIHKLTSK